MPAYYTSKVLLRERRMNSKLCSLLSREECGPSLSIFHTINTLRL